MKKLIKILTDRGLKPKGKVAKGLKVDHVTDVSSRCRKGSMFVAIKGFKADGHEYLEDAASRGCKIALVSEEDITAPKGMSLIHVEDTRRALGPLAHEVAGAPTRAMDVVGVTGTNGKTTTVYLMEAILRAAGRSPGMIGTIVNRWADYEAPSDETTPSAAQLAEKFAQMRSAGADSAAIEVSSHAIDQRRADGIFFRAVGLTNVTQDHLDYHNTMEDYAATKMQLFEQMREENPEAVAVINLDDPTGQKIARLADPEYRLTYAIRAAGADLQAETILFHDEGMRLNISFKGRKFAINSPMPCYYNASNLLTATGLSLALGLEPEVINEGCQGFRGAPGRFEMIDAQPGVKVIVDYAHTPDAFAQVLLNARGFARKRLIVVFGCGGDRDKGKRPKMGKTAGELAHEIILTNDNPRTEEPKRIIDDIIAGIGNGEKPKRPHRVILDRQAAIRVALENACEGDAVVIAGKGHEDYQIIGAEKSHFDDRETVRAIIEELHGMAGHSTQTLSPTESFLTANEETEKE